MSTPRALVDSSTMGADTTREKSSVPDLLPVEDATRKDAEVLITSEITVATPAPHRKAALRIPGGSGSHLSIHQTAAMTMHRGTSASASASHPIMPVNPEDCAAEK